MTRNGISRDTARSYIEEKHEEYLEAQSELELLKNEIRKAWKRLGVAQERLAQEMEEYGEAAGMDCAECGVLQHPCVSCGDLKCDCGGTGEICVDCYHKATEPGTMNYDDSGNRVPRGANY